MPGVQHGQPYRLDREAGASAATSMATLSATARRRALRRPAKHVCAAWPTVAVCALSSFAGRDAGAVDYIASMLIDIETNAVMAGTGTLGRPMWNLDDVGDFLLRGFDPKEHV